MSKDFKAPRVSKVMVAVILVEPEHPGNIGSVCRVMANFGFKELIIINPQCEITQETKNLAKNAQDIVNSIRIADWSVLKEFSVLAATAGIKTSDLNLHRSPLTPRQAAEKIMPVADAALVFGRERNGLTNKELELMDFVITIPTSDEYPSMNLSHSVAVMLYECYLAHGAKQFTPIKQEERKVIEEKMNALLDSMIFPTDGKRTTQKKIWKNVFGRSILTRAEARALLGFFRILERQQRKQPTIATKRTKQ